MKLKITIKFSVNFFKMVIKYTLSLAMTFLKELLTSRYLFIITRMSVRHFLENSTFKSSSLEVPNNKEVVPKKFRKTRRKLYMPASLFQ